MIRVERHPAGVRVHIGPRRWHHAHSGLLLILAGVRLIWTDRRDWPWR